MARSVLPALLGILAGASAGLAMPAAKADSLYVIDGIVLGEQAEPGRDYRCEPARLSSDFTWCQRTRQEKTRRGTFSSTISILSNQRGDAVYVNRVIEPAFFGPNDVASEISRLSTRFGERARETRLPVRDDAPSGVIAVWGKLQLQPLDGAALAALDAGSLSAQDLLVDPLGDLKRSLELGLPVYRLGGGAGYLWSASHVNGRGHLRFLTADPSALVLKPQPAAAKAKPKTVAAAYPASTLGGTAAVLPTPEHTGGVSANLTVRAKSKPDYAVPVPPRTELERVILESERVAPEHTGSIRTAPAGADAEAPPPSPPSLHRLESILALAGVAAVLLFFFASLIERLVREPTGLELLELERQRELAAELAEPNAPDALAASVQPEGCLASLRRIATSVLGFASFGGGLKSVVLRLSASVPRA
jgi:hypothetical protein